MDFNNINDARKILCDYHNGVTGSFATALLNAWGKADYNNQLYLSIGFPRMAQAIREWNGCNGNQDFYNKYIRADVECSDGTQIHIKTEEDK